MAHRLWLYSGSTTRPAGALSVKLSSLQHRNESEEKAGFSQPSASSCLSSVRATCASLTNESVSLLVDIKEPKKSHGTSPQMLDHQLLLLLVIAAQMKPPTPTSTTTSHYEGFYSTRTPSTTCQKLQPAVNTRSFHFDLLKNLLDFSHV